MSRLVEIIPVVMQEKILNVDVFSLFRNYLSLGKGVALYLKKLSVPFTIKGCFLPSLVDIGSVVLEVKIFLLSSIYICFFVIISPRQKA